MSGQPCRIQTLQYAGPSASAPCRPALPLARLSASIRSVQFRQWLALTAIIALAGCAATDPPRPEQPRTTVVEVPVPVPVPCMTEAERPTLPTPTPIDPETATALQLANAKLADALALLDYAERVDRLFLKCVKP